MRLFLVVLLVLAACEKRKADFGAIARIIGGTQANYVNNPIITWQVAVQVRSGSQLFLCGGSIIASNFVLTAGHCVVDTDSSPWALRDPSQMSVIPGINRDDTTNARSVARYWVEPSYTQNAQSSGIDLAILQLVADFPLSSTIAVIPMCSGSLATCYPAGASLIVSGYGETQSDVSSSTSRNLMYAQLTAIDQTTCANKYNSNFRCGSCFPTNNVCAGPNPSSSNHDSCFGDSGGPLVRTLTATSFQLVGVVSSGTVPAGQPPSCGSSGNYGVYVSVPLNRVWIDSVLAHQRDSQAVNNSCFASNSCPVNPGSGGGGGGSVPGFAYYYIIIAAIGGIILLIFLIICICKCCASSRRSSPPPRQNRPAPAPVHAQPAPMPMQPMHSTSYSVQVTPAPSAPPAYGAPVYQPSLYANAPPSYAPAPQYAPQYGPPGQAPAPVYSPQQMYNPPPPSEYGRM